MKAAVFAAGIGSRLKPFTDSHPKAMATIGGRPALALVLERLAAAGAAGIVVNVHHFAGEITDYLHNHDFGVPIEVSDESAMLLDTAGALAKMSRESTLLCGMAPDEPVIVHNADIVTDFDLRSMVSAHMDAKADATILVDSRRHSSRSFLFGSDGMLRGWHNAATGTTRPAGLDTERLNAAPFGGVHVLRRAMLDHISDAMGPLRPMSITDFYIDNANTYSIRAFTPDGPYRWHDIGTPEKLEAARQDFAS